MKIPGAGKVELVYTAEDGSQTKELVHEFDGPGIVQGMHNINKSIESICKKLLLLRFGYKTGSVVCNKGYNF